MFFNLNELIVNLTYSKALEVLPCVWQVTSSIYITVRVLYRRIWSVFYMYV